MRCLLFPCPSANIPSHLIPSSTATIPSSQPLKLRPIRYNSRRRGISVVTRGLPSTTTYILAFVFPLSLLAITILVSINVVDKLDQKFLEEFAMEQAMLEEDENGNEVSSSPERETVPDRVRNRPKREVESSSM